MGEKYTPGPWSLNKYGEPVDANGENIRANGLVLTNTDEAKANSVLIAAAPELLAALLAAKVELEACELELTGEGYNNPALNAAIAKATSP